MAELRQALALSVPDRDELRYLPEGPIALDDGHGPHVVLMFQEPSDYFQYISHFHPEGDLPMSGGVCINRGYVHYAFPSFDHSGYRTVLTHEMTHSRLHRNMGLRNLVAQPFPTWFDEGLATFVAAHPNWNGQVTLASRQRIREVRRFWNWDDAYRELGVGRAYASAAAEIASIEQRVGRDGLLELIRRADAGESFDQVLVDLQTR